MIAIRFVIFVLFTWMYVTYYYVSVLLTRVERMTLLSRAIQSYLLRMGPLYIKFGQILATRSDLLPREIIVRLRQLQDDVPPMKRSDLECILRRAYPHPLSETFAEFSYEPIASASIAQVHAARLHDGRKVAIKIVKKHVRKQLQENLLVVSLLVRIIHRLYSPLRHLNLPSRFEEFREILVHQAEMTREAANQSAMYALFKGHPYARVPELVPELCTEDVLVMDFVDAIRGNEVHMVTFPRQQLARRFQDIIYTMLYMDGFCHADPHPGNVFFTNEGDIILVDFGIVASLTEDEKWALSSFYYACTRREWQLAVTRLTEQFVTDRGTIEQNLDCYIDHMASVLRYHFAERYDCWSTFEFFDDCNKVLRKYGAKYTTSFTKVEIVFVSCEGVAQQVDPDIDIWENARKYNDRFSPYMNPLVKATFDAQFAESMPGSIALRERAQRSLIAPTHIDRYFLPSAYPLFIKEASGCRLTDVDGNSYIDLSCGYGPHVLGYRHPVIVEALGHTLSAGWINALGSVAEVELAELLVDAFPVARKAIFSNSGTEAVVQAVRICRAYRKRDVVAKCEGHYHGFSDQGIVSSWFRFTGAMDHPGAVGGPGCHRGIVKDTLVLQYGHAESIAKLWENAERIACVIVEPMPAAMADYDVSFLQELRSTCSALDIPLIFDEVVTGFRVTYGGVQALTGVSADLTCLGKIIGGGLPCGAVVGKDNLITIAKTSGDPFVDFESKVFVGGTMSGNSLTCATGTAALRYLKAHPEIYDSLRENTEWLAGALRRVARKHGVPLHVKAQRSIFSVTFSTRPPRFHREKLSSNFKANLGLAYYMRARGVYMPELHTMMLNAMHTRADLEIVRNAFDESLGAMVNDGFFAL